nr:hypothetical protein [Paraburkholderia sp. J41]
MRRHVLSLPFVALTAAALTVATIATVTLGACANRAQEAPANAVGADADAHGCRASAGYAWCEHTQRCERPWELAQQKQFAPDAAQFAHYCATGSAAPAKPPQPE